MDVDAHDDDTIMLKGSAEAWNAFLRPIPARHCHNVLAMDQRRDDFTIASGRHRFIQDLRAIDLAFGLMRAAPSDLDEARR